MKSQKPLFTPALSLFTPSIVAFRSNLVSFVVVGAIPISFFTTGILSQVLTTDAADFVRGIAFVVGLLSFILALVTGLATGPGFGYLQYKSAQGVVVSPGKVYKKVLKVGARWWGLTILVNLTYLIGLICLVVPFFFMAKRYMLAQFYFFDQDASILESMQLSAERSRVYPEALWSLIGVQVLLGLTVAIPIVGIVFSWIPNLLYACAPGIRYFELKEAPKVAPRYTR